MWYFQVKDSSIITPRYFIHCFRSNAWEEPSLLLMLRLNSISLFLADLIIMKFVLPILIDNLLISQRFFLLLLVRSSLSVRVILNHFQKRRHWTSSAKILKHNFSEQFGKSFVYIKNKRGPNVFPCGMPHNTVWSVDLISPNATYCFLLERELWNLLKEISLFP